jgi:molybdate transport system substrate-binding protein
MPEIMPRQFQPHPVRDLQTNEFADVTILSRPLMDGLQQQGKVVPSSIVDIAHSAVAMAIRKGAPKPDISSVDGVKRALLAAKSITYPDVTRGGATGFLVTRVLERLGIAEEMKPKTKFPRPGEFAAAVLARGEADIAILQPMEIVGEAGTELVGLLPPEMQSPQEFVFSAGLLAGAKETQGANAFIHFLSGPVAAAFFKAKGMQPG